MFPLAQKPVDHSVTEIEWSTVAKWNWTTERSLVVLPTRQPKRLLDEEIEPERMAIDENGVLGETSTEMTRGIDQDLIAKKASVIRLSTRARVDQDQNVGLLVDEPLSDWKKSLRPW
jgi:hypothetical protein